MLRNAIESNKTWKDVIPAVEPLCEEIFTSMGLNGTVMCPGILSAYAPIVSCFCHFVLQARGQDDLVLVSICCQYMYDMKMNGDVIHFVSISCSCIIPSG